MKNTYSTYKYVCKAHFKTWKISRHGNIMEATKKTNGLAVFLPSG